MSAADWPRDPEAFRAYLLDWQERNRPMLDARYQVWRGGMLRRLGDELEALLAARSTSTEAPADA